MKSVLGKTLSMATAALSLCLLSDRENKKRKPVIIFAPATLCEQWQTEMIDKLGIPCARWQTQKKAWLDPEGRVISPAGQEHIAKCPLRVGIVSTGLDDARFPGKAALARAAIWRRPFWTRPIRLAVGRALGKTRVPITSCLPLCEKLRLVQTM